MTAVLNYHTMEELMPIPEDKPLFAISVAAEILGVHPRTIMLYEKAGFLTPFRTQTNRRRFSRNDLRRLFFIKYLTQKKNVNLGGVKILLKALEEGRKHQLDLKATLFPDFKEEEVLREAFSR